MKKFVMGLIVGSAITLCGSAFAEDGLQKIEAYLRPDLPITLNGQPITLNDSPVMVDGNTYLRLRNLQQVDPSLQVSWNETTQTVELSTYGVQTAPITTPTPTTSTGGANVTTTLTIDDVNKQIEAVKRSIIGDNAAIQNVTTARDSSPNASDADKKTFEELLSKAQQQLQVDEQKLSDLQAQLAQLQAQ